MITRETVPVQRTTYRRLMDYDVEYATQRERDYGTYPYVCHGCGSRLTTGQRYCNLLNISGSDYNIWCMSCARQYPRNANY